MITLRAINWNIHGANVPGKASREKQGRSWHHLGALGCNLGLLQEVEGKAIPTWVGDEWSVLKGEMGKGLKGNVDWGSAIIASTGLNLRPRPDLLEVPYLHLLYDYVVVGEIDLPGGEPAIVASVHARASLVSDFLKMMTQPADVVGAQDLEAMTLPGGKPWVCDLVFHALNRVVQGRRFIIGGDWNTARLFDDFPERYGPPIGASFFHRAHSSGWMECHSGKNEECSYFKASSSPFQLDHAFSDKKTAKALENCRVADTPIVRELSDHAPMVTEFEF